MRLRSPRGAPHRPAARAVLLVLIATSMLGGLLPRVASADQPADAPGGTDTALADTDSVKTLAGTGPFKDLRVKVNQTSNLQTQAVSVTWTGAVPTDGDPSSFRFMHDFLQIFQCWGDDGTGTGPPPEQCQFGGLESVPGKFPSTITQTGSVPNRQVNHNVDQSNFDPTQGYLDALSQIVFKPFRSVDGRVINRSFEKYAGPAFEGSPGQVWVNPLYDYYTSNEIDYAKTDGLGHGSELFQVDTGQDAPGLGCGKKSFSQPDGTTIVPKCWLVVVPRGSARDENANDSLWAQFPRVQTSPLAATAWNHRIVFPLDFNPADATCSIGAGERRIVGGELATPAVSNWQPKLCSITGLPPYSYGSISEDAARRIVVSGAAGAAGMAVVSRPLDPDTVDPTNPVVYAPLTISAPVIGFNVERPNSDDPSLKPFTGVRVAHLQLTPRLVAKLLTESYSAQLFIGGGKPDYPWMKTNPVSMATDPDFLQYNPGFKRLTIGYKDFGGLVLEQSTSDAALAMWEWVLADPEAKAWLDGAPDTTGCPASAAPDTCGMKVNPLYSTSPQLNPSGKAFGTPVPNAFSKSDPYCYQPPPDDSTPPITPRKLCMQDSLPYAASMELAAQATRAANDGAKVTHIPTYGQTGDTWWSADGPQILGYRAILSVTDSASAARYGLQTASLSRAGDDTPARTFAAPDQAGLLAGVRGMMPGGTAGVLAPDPATKVAGAYPLTMLTYAAVTPRGLDPAARGDYAAFVEFGAGEGQTPGRQFGQLPPGYAPLPDSLRALALATAAVIRAGDPPESSPTTTTAPGTGGQAGGSSGTPRSGSAAPPSTVVGGVQTALPPPVRTPQPNGLPLQLLRTAAQAVGALRYLLPIAVAVGMLAALGAWLLGRRRPKAAPTRPPASLMDVDGR